jgi:hypothetical protein
MLADLISSKRLTPENVQAEIAKIRALSDKANGAYK